MAQGKNKNMFKVALSQGNKNSFRNLGSRIFMISFCRSDKSYINQSKNNRQGFLQIFDVI